MGLPVTCKITDIYGATWEFGADTPVQLVYDPSSPNPTGLMGAEYSLDEYSGPGMPGTVVVARNDQVNVIGCRFYIYGPQGADGRNVLSEFVRGHGRGFARQAGGPLMRFEVEETGRFQMVRATLTSQPEIAKIHACGRAYQEVEYRSDETWWRKDPDPKTFTAAQFATATVPNAGDVESWPHYKIVGPLNGGTIGLMGEALSLPNIAAGKTLEIDTDPRRWTVVDQDGVDRSEQINAGNGVRWHTKAPVSATDEPVDVPVTITGTGTTSATSVTVTIPQLYWAAL